ncbi:response regulator [Aquabacterium sp. CECT 9606]|uniref:response regulator n=1 Tax=Aquabacterium sp. CECT 9606 TaxID=2845822 RepID=UPI001E4D17FF|nr:response regulator [Aquabacterium sp. CECT 9606]CAH0351286.1 Sensor histidine kinase RcsC [Aquabacterium sp. CECT 9606]
MPEKTSLETAHFQRVLKRHLALPLAVGAFSAMVFIGLIFFLLSQLNWVEHTQRVIGNANELKTVIVDQETGTRGFLLTGEDKFLSPYNLAKPKMASELASLKALVQDNQHQLDRLNRIEALQRQWDEFAQRIIELRRSQGDYLSIIRAETGKQLFDEIRREVRDFLNEEDKLLQERNEIARSTTFWVIVSYVSLVLILSGLIALSGRRQIMTLSENYGDALRQHVLSTKALQEKAWFRIGQTQLAERLLGQLALPVLSRQVLEFMAGYLGVAVAALYVRNAAGKLHRVGTYGFSKELEAQEQSLDLDHGLVGQVAKDGQLKHIPQVPDHHFQVTTGLSTGAPTDVVLLPISNDGQVNGVIELGFMRPVVERDLELLRILATNVGASVEAAQYRQRLQDALEETHQLNEELQTQQEELRTANEELEEQSRVLNESQTNLEHQQAELEQINVQLTEQALLVDRKNEALKQAQSELENRADELQRASRYKSEFLANMSHELRTPLNSSLILAKLLWDNKAGNLNEEQIKFAKTIYGAGNDLLTLINDILDISKVEAGKLELTPQAVSLNSLVESLRMTFTPLADDKHLAFDIQVAADAPVSIFTDRQRVEQILKNLLSNAIKFTDKGKISMTVQGRADGRLAFAVSDSGIGIAPEQQEVIFEAFRQADGTINRQYGGTGLGLSISRELAGLLGGAIYVDSEPGRGSTFTLDLPQRWVDTSGADTTPPPAPTPRPAPASARALPAAPVVANPPPESETIPSFADDRQAISAAARLVLVIEDDPQFAAILFDLAHEMNYQCLVAHGAAEGFELATRHLPHAILLDIRLPDDSGLAVLQQLKDHPQTRHIPVHIVAAEDVSEVALHMGAIGFAMKPTTREALKEVFNKLEEKSAKKVKRVLVVEDDARQRDSIVHLIGDDDIEIAAVERGEQALDLLRETVFDCMVIDLKLPDMDGSELLERMTREDICSFPPVIVYTGRNLTRQEETELNKYSRSIIIKGARSPERLLDEVTLFLHTVESQLSAERQTMLKTARNRDKVLEGRKVLLVDDDVRNIFALTSALEQRGLLVEVGRNGFEALAKLDEVGDIDLVLMDIMMPGMDGLEATRRLRANPAFAKLPVIAITAKAMKDDQEQCRRAGINDYLAKPVELERLFSLLRVWMPAMQRL